MEKYLTSLEVSRKLKEAGVRQESIFGWEDIGDEEEHWSVVFKGFVQDYHKSISAFSCGELLEMLTNEEILNYCYMFCTIDGQEHSNIDTFKLFDLMRSPDKLADVLLWKIKSKGGIEC
jgi:hypothetical protein